MVHNFRQIHYNYIVKYVQEPWKCPSQGRKLVKDEEIMAKIGIILSPGLMN